MIYKHEESTKAVVSAYLRYTGENSVIDELEEVYAKAKSFNEILNIDLDQHEIIVHGQVEDIVNKYMEDK